MEARATEEARFGGDIQLVQMQAQMELQSKEAQLQAQAKEAELQRVRYAQSDRATEKKERARGRTERVRTEREGENRCEMKCVAVYSASCSVALQHVAACCSVLLCVTRRLPCYQDICARQVPVIDLAYYDTSDTKVRS